MLQVNNLAHSYSDNEPTVKDITFHIAEGEIFGLLGPSGAGKSTIQNILTGLLKLHVGTVQYDGQDIQAMSKAFYNTIGVSFEQPNLYPNLSGLENLRYYAGLFGVPTLEPKTLLSRVGLLDSANKKTGDYSKGMKQRLVFARALLNNPKYLFLDEPTSGLDPTTSSEICEIIRKQKQDGKVIFLTTHNMELADRLCDRVAFLESGTIQAMDTPYNLKLHYGNNTVKITYVAKEEKRADIFDLNADKEQVLALISSGVVETIHTSEATLEDIFIGVTGRGLTS